MKDKIEQQRDELLAAAWDMVAACYAPNNVPVYDWRQKAIDRLKELSGWPEPIAKAEGSEEE